MLSDEPDAQATTNVALVPLGTPLLAGPGAIVATMLFVRRGHAQVLSIVARLALVPPAIVAIFALHLITRYDLEKLSALDLRVPVGRLPYGLKLTGLTTDDHGVLITAKAGVTVLTAH